MSYVYKVIGIDSMYDGDSVNVVVRRVYDTPPAKNRFWLRGHRDPGIPARHQDHRSECTDVRVRHSRVAGQTTGLEGSRLFG